MNEQVPTAKMFCPSCGQKLSVPTTDLSILYLCPRCHEVRAAAELVPKRQTVPAVPAADAEAYETAIAPQRIASEPVPPTQRDLELSPVTQPIPTVRMPHATAPIPARGALPAVPRPVPPIEVAAYAPQGGYDHRRVPIANPAASAQLGASANSAPQNWPGPAHAPPPSPTDASRPGLRTRAVEGFVAAGRFTSVVLRGAAGADRFLAGKRGPAVAGVALLVLVAPFIDDAAGAPAFSVLSLILFVAMLGLIALARLESFRDESGFRFSLISRTLGEAWLSILAWFTRIFQATWGQKLIDVAKPVLFAGLLTAAFSSLIAALGAARSSVGDTQVWGLSGLVGGALIYAAGLWTLHRNANATGLALNATSSAAAQQAVSSLSLVLDCRDGNAVASAAARSNHPLVRALLLELAKPWPRPYYDDERECQARLLKRLQLSMPEANPRTERWIGERQRADMLLGDEMGGLLIELKANVNSSSIDRLIGQAWKYLDVWRGRGPMLIILCRAAPPDTAARLEREVDRMRRDGHAVLAVFAMP